MARVDSGVYSRGLAKSVTGAGSVAAFLRASISAIRASIVGLGIEPSPGKASGIAFFKARLMPRGAVGICTPIIGIRS